VTERSGDTALAGSPRDVSQSGVDAAALHIGGVSGLSCFVPFQRLP
jgi:hypothetical protein